MTRFSNPSEGYNGVAQTSVIKVYCDEIFNKFSQSVHKVLTFKMLQRNTRGMSLNHLKMTDFSS